MAGAALGILLAFPLILRYLFVLDFAKALGPILGSIFIVGLSAVSAMISQDKKLFEVLIFFLMYGNINRVTFLDYFGGTNTSIAYFAGLLLVCGLLLSVSLVSRSYQLRDL